jgi:hypothetical protein
MVRLFDEDIKCRVFGEFKRAVCGGQGDAHSPQFTPGRRIDHQSHARALVVAKPLVETQNVTRLLDYFPGSKEGALRAVANEAGHTVRGRLRPLALGRLAAAFGGRRGSIDVPKTRDPRNLGSCCRHLHTGKKITLRCSA